MGNLKTIRCEICGQFAQVSARRKLNYCDRPECVQTMNRKKWVEYTNKYMKKKRAEKKAEETKKTTLIKRTYIPQANTVATPTVKDTLNKAKVNTDALDNIEIYDIREIARELGTIRFKLIEMYQKENEQVKALEKDDLTLLHAFELEDLTKDDVWRMYQETKSRRTTRRGGKDRRILIGTLLSSILIKSPDKFIVKAINDGRQNKDFPEVVEELKKDETLFVQSREKEEETTK